MKKDFCPVCSVFWEGEGCVCPEEKKIKVVYKEPGKQGEVLEIENKLEEFQRLVGGYIEVVHLWQRFLIICNEEGKLLELEPNLMLENNDVICGPIVVVGDAGEEFRGLTDSEIKHLIG